jgi:hypothetical protein
MIEQPINEGFGVSMLRTLVGMALSETAADLGYEADWEAAIICFIEENNSFVLCSVYSALSTTPSSEIHLRAALVRLGAQVDFGEIEGGALKVKEFALMKIKEKIKSR